MGDGATARISVAEMKSYYLYCEWCSWLLSVAEGECRRRAGPWARLCRVGLVLTGEGVWNSLGTGLWVREPFAHLSPDDPPFGQKPKPRWSEPRRQSGRTPSRAPGGEVHTQSRVEPSAPWCLRARDSGSLAPQCGSVLELPRGHSPGAGSPLGPGADRAPLREAVRVTAPL